jgi:hypothetical protein
VAFREVKKEPIITGASGAPSTEIPGEGGESTIRPGEVGESTIKPGEGGETTLTPEESECDTKIEEEAGTIVNKTIDINFEPLVSA